ncbi:MAG: OmpA family protein [Bacteroidetes bacterium]|nr:OmpA family protein [Fibrella sp.]
MNYLLLLTLLIWLTGCQSGRYTYRGQSNAHSQSPSVSDQNGRSADPGVRVLDIELTPDYTVLYMTFVDRDQTRYDSPTTRKPTIAIEPNGQLMAANGARTFRFIRAEGIPVKPEKLETSTGDQVDFVLYFERLDKGLEYFDLYQCNDTDQAICWNMYDLFVKNPADPVYVLTPESTPVAPVSTGLTVTGTVRDANNNRPVSATIDYKVSSSKTSVDSVQSFAATGLYRLNLDRGQVYTYVASARGYRVGTGTLDLSDAGAGQKFTRDIALTPLAVGDKIELKNVYFEMSKADLLSASFAELNQVVTMMQDNPQMTIRLEGHTDIIGDPGKNQQLSKDRVWACRDHLVERGIDRSRISAIGYGDTRPLVTKGTDEDRKVNRRVEFVVLSL